MSKEPLTPSPTPQTPPHSLKPWQRCHVLHCGKSNLTGVNRLTCEFCLQPVCIFHRHHFDHKCPLAKAIIQKEREETSPSSTNAIFLKKDIDVEKCAMDPKISAKTTSISSSTDEIGPVHHATSPIWPVLIIFVVLASIVGIVGAVWFAFA